MNPLPALTDCSLTVSGRVATLIFRRQEIRNTLTGTEIPADIVKTVDWANATPEISALILTGDGSAFSAGGNIKTMGNRSSGPPHELQRNYKHGIQRIPYALDRAEMPLIAAVNGPAIGAGFDMANMCDLRIASSAAQFGETFVNLGIIPGDGGALFLSRIVGYQRAAELTFSGRILKAEEALALGIVLEVVAPEALMARAQEIGDRIGSKPPVAVRYAKRLLKLAQQQTMAEHLEVCAAFQALCHKTEDHHEALQAFFEKRKGVFHGK